MSFAFGLAVLGSALAVGLRAYLVTSAAEQRDVLDRITLESAANEVLGRLAAGERHSIKPSSLPVFEMNRRRVAVGLSLPEGKLDLKGDADPVVLNALKRNDLNAPSQRTAPPSSFDALGAMSRMWRFSARQEDCLRSLVTLGRAPEVFRTEAASGDGGGLVRSITAGDQVDVRSSLETPAGSKVLWLRARFTGAMDRPWRVHDYRILRPGLPTGSCNPQE